MTTNYHSPYQDGVTDFTANDMNAPLSSLDTQITALSSYTIGMYFTGVPTNSQIILAHIFGTIEATFPEDLTGSKAKSQDAATAEAVFTINKNGGQVGTITWSAAGTTGAFSFSSAISFAEDDVLTIVGPASADTTLGRISITLKGSRN